MHQIGRARQGACESHTVTKHSLLNMRTGCLVSLAKILMYIRLPLTTCSWSFCSSLLVLLSYLWTLTKKGVLNITWEIGSGELRNIKYRAACFLWPESCLIPTFGLHFSPATCHHCGELCISQDSAVTLLTDFLKRGSYKLPKTETRLIDLGQFLFFCKLLSDTGNITFSLHR